jgi:hypothetical protein
MVSGLTKPGEVGIFFALVSMKLAQFLSKNENETEEEGTGWIKNF